MNKQFKKNAHSLSLFLGFYITKCGNQSISMQIVSFVWFIRIIKLTNRMTTVQYMA